ncbi:hypothetical protein F4780DRAFT_358617 [Xylariomycetidae sp. FL0641]|nr:hypothetical protein F4780DRAFT_358617 [Xylariomycetidae sp. FL0641]
MSTIGRSNAYLSNAEESSFSMQLLSNKVSQSRIWPVKSSSCPTSMPPVSRSWGFGRGRGLLTVGGLEATYDIPRSSRRPNWIFFFYSIFIFLPYVAVERVVCLTHDPTRINTSPIFTALLSVLVPTALVASSLLSWSVLLPENT